MTSFRWLQSTTVSEIYVSTPVYSSVVSTMILKQQSFSNKASDNIVTVTNNILTNIFEDFLSCEFFTCFRIIGDTYGVPFSQLFTELQISPIEVHISPIQSLIQLQTSPIQLEISTNRPI